MRPNRQMLAEKIVGRLAEQMDGLRHQWQASTPINHFVLDDVLPEECARAIGAAFPQGSDMTLKRSLRELKYVAAQMNEYDPLLEEAVYAFQAPEIVTAIEKITDLKALEPDHLLYAGGISMMARGHFLNPHVDNSHDKFKERYRVLNLLYYASPNWSEEKGGNLELWPNGPKDRPVTIVSKFNRLAVMVTHQESWHSVSKIVAADNRCCVSNYYFSKHSVRRDGYFHVTSFRGRPEQPIRDLVLRGDVWLRTTLRKLLPSRLKGSSHYYKKVQ